MAEILRFLESMDTPDLSRVEAFLQARGVSAEKLRAAYGMLEQMGIRYDSPPEEMPDQGDTDVHVRPVVIGPGQPYPPAIQGHDGQEHSAGRLNSSEDVLNYLKNMKKE